jgi:hypothetical protein
MCALVMSPRCLLLYLVKKYSEYDAPSGFIYIRCSLLVLSAVVSGESPSTRRRKQSTDGPESKAAMRFKSMSYHLHAL